MLPASADVLVLGAGLAGLRAALSCLEAAPGLRVLVVSLKRGPSGSSFANVNDALGFHACLTDREREDYLREVAALNRGAWLSPRLLDVQAREGGARLEDLQAMGVPFALDEEGALQRHSSCFSPHSRRAYVFKPLSSAYQAFKARLDALGCRFAHGWLPAALLGQGENGEEDLSQPWRVRGAALVPASGGGVSAVAAKAVIVALGGPGRLFAHSMAGPGNPGYGQGLLARAGARMANLGYLQFMWARMPGLSFWQPAGTGSGGWRFGPGEGTPVERAVENLAALAPARAGHCPFGHGLEDSALDLALAQALDDSGLVRMVPPDGSAFDVAPTAHASNGGAVIDEHARTSVPGLFAAGECATGMHGSNRLGGGMVLATQVFGHRAGVAAASEASGRAHGPSSVQLSRALPRCGEDRRERDEALAWLGSGLSRYAVLGGCPGAGAFAEEVRSRLEAARDWRLSLCLETALGILEGLPGPTPVSRP